MPLFSYRATDATGATEQGTIDAVHADAARESLLEKGWTPIDVSLLSAEPFSFVTPQPQQIPIGTETIPFASPTKKIYFPIAATLRLYAGWLLAYYALVYAVGWYAHSRPLPFEIPYVESLFLSPLVLSFTFAAFLFLVFHTIKRSWGRELWKGIVLGVLGVGVFVVYRMNIV